jgi:hypothetical protein
MKTKQTDAINHLVAHMRLNQEREDAELKKLMERPELFDVATKITDALLKDLIYLCNFDHVVAGNGKRYSINALWAKLSREVKQTFLKLTGKHYKPDIQRTVEYREKNKKR